MQKLLTTLAAAGALALAASTAQADCAFHNKMAMASNAPTEESVSLSTHEEPATTTVVEEVAATDCPAGQTDCAPAQK